jgi:nucleotide-binding universal stress UspA family protein
MRDASTERGRPIVVGVDGSAAAHRALLWAADYARTTNAEVLAVHAIQPFWTAESYEASEDLALAYKNWQVEMEAVLEDRWCACLRGAGVRYRSHTVEGGPSAVLGLSNRRRAQLIVVGRSGRSGLTELLLGSFSHHVVHHASVPVVVVPGDGEV